MYNRRRRGPNARASEWTTRVTGVSEIVPLKRIALTDFKVKIGRNARQKSWRKHGPQEMVRNPHTDLPGTLARPFLSLFHRPCMHLGAPTYTHTHTRTLSNKRLFFFFIKQMQSCQNGTLRVGPKK